MPKDFIKKKHSHNDLVVAAKQQKQLSYFTQSKVQDDVTLEYIKNWANRNYSTDDYFFNFVKSILKTENFLLIFKHLRFPLPSARLIQDKIKAPLKRVFYSEDPFFKYTIKGETVKEPDFLNINEFNEQMFNALLFRHNDILITDLNEVNSPYRNIIEIDNVVSIESHNGIISKIAYTAEINDDDENEIKGYLYLDDKRYVFLSQDLDKELINVEHDLGRCPADYISLEAFGSDCDVVRKSIFSCVREELEEYTFLKALQRMAEVKSAIPTVAMLDLPVDNENETAEGLEGEPMSADSIGGQRSSIRNTIDPSRDIMGVGNVALVPLVRNDAGDVETDIINNYLKFFYIPIESLDYLNKRIKEIHNSIISNILGNYSEGALQEGSKSDLEAGINITSRQDKLRELSQQLSRIRTRSDYNFLALKYGRFNVSNEAFYGSDFFLESQSTIFDLLAKSPNPIESKSLLIKSARNRHRFNKDSFTREYILYQLLPYGLKEDFNLAVEKEQIGEITFQLQTRFNYWIGLFEAEYDNILSFWNTLEGNESEKIVFINNLITIIIKDNYEKSSVVTSLSREQNPS